VQQLVERVELGDWAWPIVIVGKVCTDKKIIRFVEQVYALQQINTLKSGLGTLLKGKKKFIK
jgi:hypothetical protein